MQALIIMLLVAIAPPAAAANVFRCTDAAGRVEYRDSPCRDGAAGHVLELGPPNAIAEIDQSAARAAGNAIAARAAERIAADQAEAHRRRVLAAMEARQEAAAEESAPGAYGWWNGTDPYARPQHEHRARVLPPIVIQRPPPSLPADMRNRRF